MLGCDIVVAGSAKVLTAMKQGRTTAVINTHETLPGDFARDPDFSLPGRRLVAAIEAAAGSDASRFIDATEVATQIFGDAIAANMFLLGYGWQLGALPLTRDSIEEAIRLNKVSVEMNLAAFAWGRRFRPTVRCSVVARSARPSRSTRSSCTRTGSRPGRARRTGRRSTSTRCGTAWRPAGTRPSTWPSRRTTSTASASARGTRSASARRPRSGR